MALNNRKRFVISAALAALFVLLAGGANALATTNTVWCVPNASVSPACTSGAGKVHIQDAVGLAQPGDVIIVGPGKYYESVTVLTSDLTILGAQAGKDAREDRHGPESIVDGSTTANPPFTLLGQEGVVIDGFTLQGDISASTGVYPAGIYVEAPSLGIQVLNNIIQNNSTGVYIYDSGYVVVEHNLFKNNSAGSGLYVGYGIYSYLSTGLSIDGNEFTGNQAAALVMLESANTAITNNTSEKDGTFVVFYLSSNDSFGHNQGRDFGAKGVMPVYISFTAYFTKLPSHITITNEADAAVDIGPANAAIAISDNDLEEGKSPISNGVAFTTVFGFVPTTAPPTLSSYITVKDNNIERFPLNGILVGAGPFSSQTWGTIYNSGIAGNRLKDNGNDGILIQYADPVTNSNYENQLFANDAEDNHVNDCEDDTATYGSFTAETYNTWIINVGSRSEPTGLCSPGTWH
jgi:parallel beta-helix repeat protein